MGRALAVSKLSQIKNSVSIIESNMQKETKNMLDSMTNMLAKHQPGEIDDAPLNAIKNKSEIVFATIPNINKLE